MSPEDYTKEIAQKAGYSEQIITLLSSLMQIFPEGFDISWCRVDGALKKHYSETDIIKLALTAPHCDGFFITDEPTLEELISYGEELYSRHCNADGSFRFEDFDTPEKLDAFDRERDALAAAADIDDEEEDDTDTDE